MADPCHPCQTSGMAEHSEKPDSASDVDETKGKRDVDWSGVKDQVVGVLAGIVRWVGLIFAVILVLHIVFTVAEANPTNGIVEFVQSWAEGLTLGFKDLFTPEDEKLQVLVNFGIAAIFWLIVSSVGSSLIRRIGGALSK